MKQGNNYSADKRSVRAGNGVTPHTDKPVKTNTGSLSTSKGNLAVNTAGQKNQNQIRRTNKTSPAKKQARSGMKAIRAPKIITVRNKERKPFPTSVVFTILILVVLVLFMMMNYAEIDKYSNDIARLEAKVTRLRKDEHDLGIKLDKKDKIIFVEDYAVNTLGMVKSETLPREYVSLLPPDKSEIIKYDDGAEGGLGFLLTGMGEVIIGFLK